MKGVALAASARNAKSGTAHKAIAHDQLINSNQIFKLKVAAWLSTDRWRLIEKIRDKKVVLPETVSLDIFAHVRFIGFSVYHRVNDGDNDKSASRLESKSNVVHK